MNKQLFENNTQLVITEFLSSTDNSIQVQNTDGLRTLGDGEYYVATIVPVGGQGTTEIIRIIDIDDNFLTVLRGQENTSPQNFLFGSLIELRLTAGALARIGTYNFDSLGAVERTVTEKLYEYPSIRDYGAIGDGNYHPVSDWIPSRFPSLGAIQAEYPMVVSLTDSIDWAATQSAANKHSTIYVPEGKYILNREVISRLGGFRMLGPGQILVDDNYNGREQLNSYRGTRDIATGKEYFWAVYNVIENTNRAIRCYTYGDSTVEGGFNFIDWPFFLQQYLPDAVAAKGVRNYFSVVNRGVGGSNLSTWNPLPDIGVNSANPADLVILKCGINDASLPIDDRLELFNANLRSRLEQIRGTSGGSVGETAILLVGPNSTIDKRFHKRTAEWYEQLRGIFESAAEDFKCAYFDTYAYLRDVGALDDTLWASNRWLDDAEPESGFPVSLHPKNIGQSWIWGAIVDWIFGDSETLRWSGNKIVNKSTFFGQPKADPSWFPNNYQAGITLEVCFASDGYPMNGILQTTRSLEGPVRQELWSLDEACRVFSRTANAVGNFFGEWRGIRSDITFTNSWSNFGSVYATASASVSDGDITTLMGLIKPGITTAGTTMFILPINTRPGNQHLITTSSNNGLCTLEILANGEVQLRSGTVTDWLTLSGINFRR